MFFGKTNVNLGINLLADKSGNRTDELTASYKLLTLRLTVSFLLKQLLEFALLLLLLLVG